MKNTPSCMTVRRFFDGAGEMRAAVDAHFSNQHLHRAETHQVWNYWHVPEQYTYLRTRPENVLGAPLLTRFLVRLRQWSIATLGLTSLTRPFLSVYVAGCQQGLHNDAENGRMAYVFSLTNWSKRRFLGGETLVFREGSYFGTRRITQGFAGAGEAKLALYRLVPPLFNQLTLFDDRLPHGVPRIEGTMDPLEGRIVLHGHLTEAGLLYQTERATPALHAAVAKVIRPVKRRIAPLVSKLAESHHGLFTVRLLLDPDGRVTSAEVPFRRLLSTRSDASDKNGPMGEIVAQLARLRFPPGGDGERVLWPIRVGAEVSTSTNLAD